MDIKNRFKAILTGAFLALYSATPVLAEDIEIYTTGALGGSTVQPNVVFIVDSSVSMQDTLSVPVDYDYTTTYAGIGCYDSNAIYYNILGTPPPCGDTDYFDKAANKCDASVQEYSGGVVIDPIGPLLKWGFYSDQVAQFATKGANGAWRGIQSKNAADRALPVECITDSGVHGETDGSKPYIEDNNSGGWTNTAPADPLQPHPIWFGAANNLQLYDGNYLNYRDTAVGTTTVSRIEVVKDAVSAIVSNNQNVNIGLMRFDAKSGQWEGGAVLYPALDAKANRNDFNTRLANGVDADSSTTLAETLYEAMLYFGGKPIEFGNDALPSNQTGTKENGNPDNYETPITEECQKNYIVLLSDGAPQLDYLDATQRAALPGFDVNSCNTGADPGINFSLPIYNQDAFDSDGSTVDNCLDEIAGWGRNNDVAERGFPAHDGVQNVTTYVVGFAFPAAADPILLAGKQLLVDTAEKGGGSFTEATDRDSLINVFNEIIAEILAVNSTFSSPAVSVNAFNRATNLDDLYFTLFKPAVGEHWEGNFKKFKLSFDTTTGDPFISDQFGDEAIDPITGFFSDGSRSFWTTGTDDGAETAAGGAASKQTVARNVYTVTGAYSNVNGVMTPADTDLTSTANELGKTNAAVTDVMLNIVGFPPLLGTTPYRETLVDWATGIDVLDDDKDGDVIDARKIMGDPLHAEPGLVQYGLTGSDADGDGLPDDPDLVAYIATNDGYLHAVDTLTGTENFTFVPQEMLPKLDNIFQDTGVNGKQYGLDGNVIPWINDINRDGDPGDVGEFVYLYFGMRRGGRDIYSMDVTNRNSPKLRWKIEGGVGDYAELGETWSTINVEKISISGTERTVLIFGGGYDVAQDTALTRTPDTIGRGIFIVDAETGEMLWRAGPDGGADLPLTDMQYSIPARIKPLDVDGDGAIDRLYAGDMGGQLWRFDIDNDSNTNAALSVEGGVIADLAVDGTIEDARRFYYPPDVALMVQEGQAPFIAVVASSGYRAHPLNTDIHDRMYMIRDFDVFNMPDYSSLVPVTEADLFDTTANDIGEGTDSQKATALTSLTTKDGWLISLNEDDGTASGLWVGEKGLSEPLILGGVAIITTFIPASAGLTASACKPNDGTGSLFFINVVDGTPTYDLSGDLDKTRGDRKEFLKRGGIPPSPSVILTKQGTPTLCVGTECGRAGVAGAAEKMYWYEK